MVTLETDRLVLRPPVEADRSRFVDLFTDEAFTVFADGVHDLPGANTRFDGMLDLVEHVPYAKQPVIEKATGTILGYTGVGTVEFEGQFRLEWGWRLVPEARGKGYATEATSALLDVADAVDDGEMLCIIAPDNTASHRVAHKLGFAFWKDTIWPDGLPSNLLLRSIGNGGSALLAPPTEA